MVPVSLAAAVVFRRVLVLAVEVMGATLLFVLILLIFKLIIIQ